MINYLNSFNNFIFAGSATGGFLVPDRISEGNKK